MHYVVFVQVQHDHAGHGRLTLPNTDHRNADIPWEKYTDDLKKGVPTATIQSMIRSDQQTFVSREIIRSKRRKLDKDARANILKTFNKANDGEITLGMSDWDSLMALDFNRPDKAVAGMLSMPAPPPPPGEVAPAGGGGRGVRRVLKLPARLGETGGGRVLELTNESLRLLEAANFSVLQYALVGGVEVPDGVEDFSLELGSELTFDVYCSVTLDMVRKASRHFRVLYIDGTELTNNQDM